MSQNKIDIGGAEKMAEALLVRPWTPVNRMLQNLCVFFCNIRNDGVVANSDCLKYN